MTKPKISVIVTSFNDAKLLPKCLDALLAQTLPDIEIIGVNDASTDNTLEVLQQYAKRDARVKVIDNPENIGLAASRNRGIERSTAPLVMFCDADDYYEATMCQEMYTALEKSQADLAISEIRVTYHAHHEMKLSDDNYYTLHYHGLQPITSDLIFSTDLSATNKIFRKSILEQYQIAFPEGKRFEDSYFCVAYFCASQSAYYVNQPLYNYIRHAGSIMSETWSKSTSNDHAIDHLHIAFLLYAFLEQHQLLDKYQELYWRFFEAFADFAIRNSKSKARLKQVKVEAKQFIDQHQASFGAAMVSTQENIRRLVSGKFYFSSARLKRTLIKFLPTYRLTVTNLQNLQHLQQKQQQLDTLITELGKDKS